jgi:hypothetical protein
MNKTISINPDLFTSISPKRTSRRKSSNKKSDSEIKIKPQKDKTKQFRKQHILRFLRQKQEDNYKKLLDNNNNSHRNPPPKRTIDDSFNGDFDESLKYLTELTNESSSNKHNFTSKNYSQPQSTTISSTLSPINIDTHSVSQYDSPINLSKPNVINASTPTWGCLKNGSLPTFRDWKKTTQKVHCLGDSSDKKTEISLMMKQQNDLPVAKLNFMKQKRTVKRKYTVGKSKTFSKIAVLVSNKTIRNNIINKTQEIKLKSIEEMKRYLMKRGFIRVGTSAPNDVICKMFETANLVCGEIENHNADNLLYNYLNDAQ